MISEFDVIHQVLDRQTPSLADNVSIAEAKMFSSKVILVILFYFLIH